MDRQLRGIVDELEMAERDLWTLRAEASCGHWDRRPAPDGWSAAECVEHLNLTSEALLPLLRAGLQEARDGGPRTRRRYRRDLVGWAIWTIMAPSFGWKRITTLAFVPDRAKPAEVALADFARWQAKIISSVREADGLPIDRVTLVSPFDVRVKFSLYSMFTLVPRHQHRHLRQAARAARVVEAVPDSALAV